MKIGGLVKRYIPEIFNYCQLQDNTELSKLLDKNYSNNTFGINFPFCVNRVGYTLDKKRFWKEEYSVNGDSYWVTSQWNIKHKTKFLDYLLKHKIIDEAKYQELDRIVQHVKTRVQKKTDNTAVRATGIEKSYKNLGTYFDKTLLDEANIMMSHYKKFYCLERSIRSLVKEVMLQNYGENWWSHVDSRVRQNVSNNMEYELDTAHTKRSEYKIDYSTFGDLRKIINTHWEIFQFKFYRNLNSVNEVLVDLNRLRVPIAHCTLLADKEIKRLDIRIDDWHELLKK